MDNELLLSSRNDIPFPEAQINIHQPTCNEISLVGEEIFWSGCQFLNFSKNILKPTDNLDLKEVPDFEIFMSIMSSTEVIEYKEHAKTVLALLFPEAEITYTNTEIILLCGTSISRINKFNFDIFKDIINSMFKLEDIMGAGSKYNPQGSKAEKIAEKLQKAKKRKESKEGKQKITLLSRFISILSVGEQKDKNDLMNYTVSQLKDEFQRYQMKYSFDMYIAAKRAGAQDLEEVDNWMDEIHS